jgi:hypothetical protein
MKINNNNSLFININNSKKNNKILLFGLISIIFLYSNISCSLKAKMKTTKNVKESENKNKILKKVFDLTVDINKDVSKSYEKCINAIIKNNKFNEQKDELWENIKKILNNNNKESFNENIFTKFLSSIDIEISVNNDKMVSCGDYILKMLKSKKYLNESSYLNDIKNIISLNFPLDSSIERINNNYFITSSISAERDNPIYNINKIFEKLNTRQ